MVYFLLVYSSMPSIFLILGAIIIVGFLGGFLAHKLKFPRITGYIVVGILLSPSLLHAIPQATVDRLDIFTSIALGIIAYSIGGSLRVESIRQMEKSIAWIAPFQSLGAWFVTTLVIAATTPLILGIVGATFLNTFLPMALVIGAISSATAPAAIMAIIHEYRAKGPLTTTLLSVVAIDDAVAILAFAVSIAVARVMIGGATGTISPFEVVAAPLMEIIGAVAIGVALSFILINVSRLVRERSLVLVVVLGTLVLCVGISEMLGVSFILANMIIGLGVINSVRREEMVLVVDDVEDVVFVIFFVLAGLHFSWDAIRAANILPLLIVLSRSAAKYVGTWIGAGIAGSPRVVREYLGLALIPKAGVSIGLALLAQRVFPEVGDIVFTAILASTIINELIAPPFVGYAIKKAGEKHAQ